MHSLGAGADTVSAGEIERAIRAGIPNNKIIFEGVKYCFVNETNEVFNIEGAFELMGIWDNNKILFDEGMVGIHNSNK